MTVTRKGYGSTTPPRRAASGSQASERLSYLVRFWSEPGSDSVRLRGYARDLKSGEELYFDDPRRFAEHVLRHLHQHGSLLVGSDDAESPAESVRKTATA